MILTSDVDSSKLRKRYRPIAGPFYEPQSGLCSKLLDHLIHSKARVIAANERDGVTIFRLRSECETLEQTAIRLRKQSRR